MPVRPVSPTAQTPLRVWGDGPAGSPQPVFLIAMACSPRRVTRSFPAVFPQFPRESRGPGSPFSGWPPPRELAPRRRLRPPSEDSETPASAASRTGAPAPSGRDAVRATKRRTNASPSKHPKVGCQIPTSSSAVEVRHARARVAARLVAARDRIPGQAATARVVRADRSGLPAPGLGVPDRGGVGVVDGRRRWGRAGDSGSCTTPRCAGQLESEATDRGTSDEGPVQDPRGGGADRRVQLSQRQEGVFLSPVPIWAVSRRRVSRTTDPAWDRAPNSLD
jgi:hypothetical protein